MTTPVWVPASAGQRPPFAPGHELSLRHGAYLPRKVDPLARELVDRVLDDEGASHVRAAACRPALPAWARAEAQVQQLSEYLAKAGEESGDGYAQSWSTTATVRGRLVRYLYEAGPSPRARRPAAGGLLERRGPAGVVGGRAGGAGVGAVGLPGL